MTGLVSPCECSISEIYSAKKHSTIVKRRLHGPFGRKDFWYLPLIIQEIVLAS